MPGRVREQTLDPKQDKALKGFMRADRDFKLAEKNKEDAAEVRRMAALEAVQTGISTRRLARESGYTRQFIMQLERAARRLPERAPEISA